MSSFPVYSQTAILSTLFVFILNRAIGSVVRRFIQSEMELSIDYLTLLQVIYSCTIY
jgi:hypothetical protein